MAEERHAAGGDRPASLKQVMSGTARQVAVMSAADNERRRLGCADDASGDFAPVRATMLPAASPAGTPTGDRAAIVPGRPMLDPTPRGW